METIEDLQNNVGKELAPSEWFLVDQKRVNGFAEATLDDSWTHTDPVRSASLGGTTVQGMLLLSLLPYLLRPHAGLPKGCTSGLNYGFDRLRFTNVLRVGKRIRLLTTLQEFSKFRESGWKKTLGLTVEIENETKPALRADWIIVYM